MSYTKNGNGCVICRPSTTRLSRCPIWSKSLGHPPWAQVWRRGDRLRIATMAPALARRSGYAQQRDALDVPSIAGAPSIGGSRYQTDPGS